jgi:hypothetical protein
MADLPISGLPAITVPSNSYSVAAVSASITSQMTLAQVAAAMSSSFTASQAISASYATSASYEINYETSSSYADTASIAVSASYATTASYAISASFSNNTISASYALTASHALDAVVTGSSSGSTLTFTKGDGSTFNLYTTPGGAFPINYGLFNQTGSSTAILGTTPSGSLIDGGIGTLTVPANGFAKGDAYRAIMFGKLTSANGHELEITVESDGVTLCDTGVITMPSVTNQNWKLDLNFSINEVGGAGTAVIASAGTFTFRTNSSGDVVSEIFSTINNTTFDTTAGNTLVIKASWTNANGSDSIYSQIFNLKKTY